MQRGKRRKNTTNELFTEHSGNKNKNEDRYEDRDEDIKSQSGQWVAKISKNRIKFTFCMNSNNICFVFC